MEKEVLKNLNQYFDDKIKKYEDCIEALRELGCPEPVLMQVISVYQQICKDNYYIKDIRCKYNI